VTTYLSTAARDQIDQAQAALEQHLVTGPDGRCTGCLQVEPCVERGRLAAVLGQYGQLPKRRPGMTRAGLRRIATSEARP
jgi:hypothetical protein